VTKDEDRILDWRSTGRRKGRRALYNDYRTYKCESCGRTSIDPPKDAPRHFEDIWPTEARVLDYPLQVNHMTKDYQNNDPNFLQWLCSPCHKAADAVTDKGVSTVEKKRFW
jgi:hypothetical protein